MAIQQSGAATAAFDPIRYATAKGRFVLAATVLGSGMAFIDSTVVSIALPAIGKDFHASVADLQWLVNAYMLTLSGLILLGVLSVTATDADGSSSSASSRSPSPRWSAAWLRTPAC